MLPEFIEVTPTLSIPTSELRFHFVRSSGPGGQNVNKLSTKVELYFNVRTSRSFSGEQRALIIKKISSQLDADGNIRVVSQTERSQYANRIKAMSKLGSVLRNALKQPKIRRPSKPTAASKEKRLLEKKVRSEKLKSRKFISE